MSADRLNGAVRNAVRANPVDGFDALEKIGPGMTAAVLFAAGAAVRQTPDMQPGDAARMVIFLKEMLRCFSPDNAAFAGVAAAPRSTPGTTSTT